MPEVLRCCVLSPKIHRELRNVFERSHAKCQMQSREQKRLGYRTEERPRGQSVNSPKNGRVNEQRRGARLVFHRINKPWGESRRACGSVAPAPFHPKQRCETAPIPPSPRRCGSFFFSLHLPPASTAVCYTRRFRRCDKYFSKSR